MLFEDISYQELWPPCSAERNHLCNFGRGYHEEQFCEIILNLDSFKIFLLNCSSSPHVQWSGTINAFLLEGIMGAFM